MTANVLRAFFRAAGDFRFSSAQCRKANLTVIEAKFLRCLLTEERDYRWVSIHFGMGQAWLLIRKGFAENPLGESGNTHTNIWRLTANGLEALAWPPITKPPTRRNHSDHSDRSC